MVFTINGDRGNRDSRELSEAGCELRMALPNLGQVDLSAQQWYHLRIVPVRPGRCPWG